MAFTLTDLRDLAAAGFDDIIDTRSRAEFAEDHLPGAINLPVLGDAERARVGTMYVQESRFGARKMGAALVIRNIADHLEGPLADKPGGWRPLVYCWRGGQRSGTFGWLLREIGWRAETLEGGYRAYRRLIAGMLHDRPLPHRVVVLDGKTCTAKTELLHVLAARGAQVIDLEGMANHRGSLFGGRAGGQPSQKAFEGRVALALSRFDPARPVVVEAESSKVGDRLVPPALWAAMQRAPRVAVTAPMAARAAFFPRAYPDLVADPEGFKAIIGQLHHLHGAERVAAWQRRVDEGTLEAVAGELMAAHYDPRYAKSQSRFAANVVETLALDSLDPAALEAAAGRLERVIERTVPDRRDRAG